MSRTSKLLLEPSERDALLPTVAIGDILQDTFNKIRRRWILLAGVLMASVVLGVLYAVTAAPVYTANGSVLLDPRVGQNPSASAQMMPGLLMSDALTVDSELRVLTSREVTASAVRELDFEPNENGEPSLRQRLTTLLGMGPSADDEGPVLTEEQRIARRNEALRRSFMQGMDVERAGESFVIDLAYTSPDPVFSSVAVNTLISEYLRLSGRQQTATVKRNQLWLESRIEELGVGVRQAETNITEYRRNNDLLSPEGQPLPTEIALNAAIAEQVRLRVEQVAIDVQAEQLQEQLDQGDVDSVRLTVENRSDALGEFQAQYAELQQQETELLLQWDENAPVVRNVRRQQEQIRDLILMEYSRALEQLTTTADILTRQVDATEDVIGTVREQYGDDIQKTVELRSLEREAEAKRQLYEQLLEEYNSASQMLTFDATSARVIAWAVPPDVKSAPQSRQIVMLAVFAGLVLAMTTIFLLEALDGSFRSPDDLSRMLGVRFLGLLPSFGSEAKKPGKLGRVLPLPIGRRREGRWSSLPRAARWIDFAATHPVSRAADTMRMIHAQLSIRRADLVNGPDGGLVLGITSSVRGEGKTMTSANLATFLARCNERAVLVDLDLITRQLSTLIGPILPEANNLSSFIDSKDGAMSRIEGIKELPGLAVIGNTDDKVDEYVTSRTVELLEEMFAELRASFDYVIVDLPPAQSAADTQLLAQLCDTLIYVVRWGKTPRDQVKSSLRQRGLSKTQIFGVLFTQAPMERYRLYNRHDVNECYA